jgi:hypothetical protein
MFKIQKKEIQDSGIHTPLGVNSESDFQWIEIQEFREFKNSIEFRIYVFFKIHVSHI